MYVLPTSRDPHFPNDLRNFSIPMESVRSIFGLYHLKQGLYSGSPITLYTGVRKEVRGLRVLELVQECVLRVPLGSLDATESNHAF